MPAANALLLNHVASETGDVDAAVAVGDEALDGEPMSRREMQRILGHAAANARNT